MTAVEWLFEKLCSEKLSWNKDSNGKLFIDLTTSNIFNQAKEMEKEQIKDAWLNSLTKGDFNSADEYYNQTYKSEQ
jgi:3-isopropylmalate dehydratase small subunit